MAIFRRGRRGYFYPGTRSGIRAFLLGIIACALTSASAPAAGTSETDNAVRLSSALADIRIRERIGAAAIARDRTIFERCLDRIVIQLNCRSQIWSKDAKGSPHLPFPQEKYKSYKILQINADQTALAFAAVDDDDRLLGFVDLVTGTIEQTDIHLSAYSQLIWTGTGKGYITNAPSMMRAFESRLARRLPGSDKRELPTMHGDDPGSVSIYASGSKASPATPRYWTLAFDRSRNNFEPVLAGRVSSLSFNTNSDSVALISYVPKASDNVRPVGWLHELTVVSRGEDGKARLRTLCTRCKVEPSTLSWRPDGRSLVYILLSDTGSPQIMRYDLADDVSYPLTISGTMPSREQRVGWTGNDPVVTGGTGGIASANWYGSRGLDPDILPGSEFVGCGLNIVWFVRGDHLYSRGRINGIRQLNHGVWQVTDRTKSGCSGENRIDLEDSQSDRRAAFDPRSGSVQFYSKRDDVVYANSSSLLRRSEIGGNSRLERRERGREWQEVVSINAQLATVSYGKGRLVRYPGRDGKPLIGWLFTPTGYQPSQGPLSTIVIIYPGTVFSDHKTEATDLSYWSAGATWAPQLYLVSGYAVFLPSLPVPETGDLDVDSDFVKLLDVAVDTAARTGVVDPKRLALAGHSYGGFSVLSVVVRSTRYRAAIAHDPIANLFSNYGEFRYWDEIRYFGDLMHYAALWAESGQGRLRGTPWGIPERYRANSPLFKVKDIRTPLMLIHGDLDDSVPVSQSEEMFSALSREGKDALFLRYWGEPHGIIAMPNIEDSWWRIHKWLGRYLNVPATAP